MASVTADSISAEFAPDEDGRIELGTQESVPVSETTLKMMDDSMENTKQGKIGEPVCLSEFEE